MISDSSTSGSTSSSTVNSLGNLLGTKTLRRLAWGLVLPLIVLNGWVAFQFFQFFQPLFIILITASILAFLLNYPVQFLVKNGIKHGYAVLMIFLLALSLFTAVGIIVIPIALGQLSELIKGLPSWIDSGTLQLQSLQLWLQAQDIQTDLKGIAIQLADRLSGQLQNLTGKVLNLAFDVAGILVNVLLTTVLTYYLLAKGDRIWFSIFKWFPPQLGHELQGSLRQNFQNYYLGQATIASLNGTVMTLAFLSLDVPFGILFGLGIGVASLIPFGGAFTITIVTSLVALENFWLGVKVLIATVLLDQIIGNVVAPRVLGNLTGLNPAWVLMSLMIGLRIGGPLGLVIAVPIASFIKTILDNISKPKIDLITIDERESLTPVS
jgi:predicted PurR-regulated permease PerM